MAVRQQGCAPLHTLHVQEFLPWHNTTQLICGFALLLLDVQVMVSHFL